MTIDIDTRTKLSEESGQTMAEYAIVLGLILIVTVATFTILSGAAAEAIDGITSLLEAI
jgi:Flp pilus assembly pilin Flp